MKQRTKEICKTVVIVLLLLSVLLLSLTAVVYSSASDAAALARLADWFGGAPSQPPRQAREPALTDASQPLLISVLGAAGRASFWGDFTRLDSAFETLGSYLAAALDTAEGPAEITQAAFERAAARPGVYFRYPGDVPLEVLAAWLDAAGAPARLAASQFLLQTDGEGVTLLAAGSEGCWRMSTLLDAAAFQEALDEYPADGTQLALESADPRYAGLDPMTLLDLTAYDVPAARSANPCDDALLTAMATTLGFNPYSEANYQDEAGGTVYTETDCSLRVSADGVLTLRNQGLAPRFSAASAGDGDRIEYVRSLTQALAGERLGDARLQFTDLSREGELVTVQFEYILSGLNVAQTGGAAVTARFSGAVLSELTLRLRTYTLSQTERLHFLPAAQAAAVVPRGALLFLAYADTGESGLQAGWLR